MRNLHGLFIYSFRILVDSHLEQLFVKRVVQIQSRGSCHSIHLDLDLYGLFQKTARLGDGYDTRNSNDKPFSFTDKETFSGVTILSASEVRKLLSIRCFRLGLLEFSFGVFSGIVIFITEFFYVVLFDMWT